MGISLNTSYKTVARSNSGSNSKTASKSKSASSSKATSSSKSAGNSKATSSSKSASNGKATSSSKSAGNSKATSSSKSASNGKATSSSKSASNSKATSSSKSTSSSKVISSNKTVSNSKVTSSSKSASSSKAASNRKSSGSASIVHNPTTSYTTTISTYKIADSSKSRSTYKPPAGYYSYKTTSSSKDSDINEKQGSKKSEVKTIKNTIINKLQINLKSVLKTSKINCDVKIQAVKKKVEKSLSESVLELEKSRDYLKRLNQIIKYDLDVASKQACEEIKNAMDLSRELIEDKDIFGKKAINFILDGCEKFTTSVVKGATKHGESFTNGLLDSMGKIVHVIGTIIDAVNPAPNQLIVSEIIEKVENGKIKLENNLQKGNYGEMKMDQYFQEEGYVRINKDRVMSLGEPVHQGIDGIYFNVDKQKGEPTYIIAEAKYNQSKLGYTKYDGKQMSDDWILGKSRIENAVGEEFRKELEKAIMKGDLEKQVVHIFPDGTKKVKKINSEGKVENDKR